jgi:hypothetical protein
MLIRIALVAVLVLEASLSLAQTADTVVNACVATAGGRVRVIDAGAACKRKERPLSWNAQGPAGDPGAPGDTGPKGDPGDPGASGPPSCRVIGRLTVAGITGDGPVGSMLVYAYHLAFQASAGGPPTILEFSVTKPLDAGSLGLAQAAIAGSIAPTGKLEIFAADGVTVQTTYDFTMAIVSSFQTETASVCATDRPIDTVTLDVATLTAS